MSEFFYQLHEEPVLKALLSQWYGQFSEQLWPTVQQIPVEFVQALFDPPTFLVWRTQSVLPGTVVKDDGIWIADKRAFQHAGKHCMVRVLWSSSLIENYDVDLSPIPLSKVMLDAEEGIKYYLYDLTDTGVILSPLKIGSLLQFDFSKYAIQYQPRQLTIPIPWSPELHRDAFFPAVSLPLSFFTQLEMEVFPYLNPIYRKWVYLFVEINSLFPIVIRYRRRSDEELEYLNSHSFLENLQYFWGDLMDVFDQLRKLQ